MLCGKCGAQNGDGAQFCSQCGNPLTAAAAQRANEEKLENLYQLARQAKADNDSCDARKYYQMILTEDPESWEAGLYMGYCEAAKCDIEQILSRSFSRWREALIKSIAAHVEGKEAQDAAVLEVASGCRAISALWADHVRNRDKGTRFKLFSDYKAKRSDLCYAVGSLEYGLGSDIELYFYLDGHDNLRTAMIDAWKHGIGLQNQLMLACPKPEREKQREFLTSYVERVKEYEPSYRPPEA